MKYMILFLMLLVILPIIANASNQQTKTINIKVNVLGEDNINNNPSTVYESSSRKSTKLVPFFILLVSGLISVALIWKLL